MTACAWARVVGGEAGGVRFRDELRILRRPLTVSLISILLGFEVGCATVNSTSNATLEDAILKVEVASKQGGEREWASNDLFRLISSKVENSESVEPALVSRIIGLLNEDDGNLRWWTARTLAVLGSQAREAAPKLLKLLPAGDCDARPLASGPMIRTALKNMGVEPPPEICR
jgi:hypothetical protein